MPEGIAACKWAGLRKARITIPSATKLRPAQFTSRRRREPLGSTCWVRRKMPVLEMLVTYS